MNITAKCTRCHRTLTEMAKVDNTAWVAEITEITAEWAKPWATDPR